MPGVNYYDGSSFSEVAALEQSDGQTAPVYRWDGSQWVKIYPTSTIPDSGVAQWRFEQDVTDSWNGYNGTDNTSAGYVTGQVGDYAKAFDGGDDYVNVGDLTPDYGGSSPWSVVAWARCESTGGQQNVYAIAEGGIFDFIIGTDGSDWSCWTYSEQNTNGYDVTGPSVNTGTWTHLAGIVESDDTIRFYVDANDQGSNTGHPGDWNDQTEHLLGTYNKSTEWWPGDIDHVSFYDKALSSSEVQNHMDTGSING